jgi:hypothetical protein
MQDIEIQADLYEEQQSTLQSEALYEIAREWKSGGANAPNYELVLNVIKDCADALNIEFEVERLKNEQD